jgi:hypothetical protein
MIIKPKGGVEVSGAHLHPFDDDYHSYLRLSQRWGNYQIIDFALISFLTDSWFSCNRSCNP